MKYTIGVDFGTLSARAVVVNAQTGEVAAEGECGYALYQDMLPNGTKLPAEMVLADPKEYKNALVTCVKNAVSGIAKEDILGISVDATALTLVATDMNGQPMCFNPQWEQEPNAWIKLWKSHSAQRQAERIQTIAEQENHPMLGQCGGNISSEWAFPKMLETYENAPEVFRQTDTFWDLCDWLTYLLTGEKTRGIGSLCNKFQFNGTAFPEEDFLNQISPGFGTALTGKLNGKVLAWGEYAGPLLPEMAEAMGLCPGIAVGSGSLDGHVAMASLGLYQSGDVMLTIGTSTVFAILAERLRVVPGVCGSGMDALIPGLAGYDSGQCSVGDTFDWFVKNQVPERYFRQAEEENCSVHELLSRMAFSRLPQPEDPIALDWWNGNRCIRGDLTLRGAVYGLSLTTKAENMYRCLVESTAFGIRNIMENFEKLGVPVGKIRACGGISQKNKHLMQCYADVLERPIEVSSRSNGAAIGAAILAAVAAGCYLDLQQAMDALAEKTFVTYYPREAHTQVYLPRYEKYLKMDRFFGDILNTEENE